MGLFGKHAGFEASPRPRCVPKPTAVACGAKGETSSGRPGCLPPNSPYCWPLSCPPPSLVPHCRRSKCPTSAPTHPHPHLMPPPRPASTPGFHTGVYRVCTVQPSSIPDTGGALKQSKHLTWAHFSGMMRCDATVTIFVTQCDPRWLRV